MTDEQLATHITGKSGWETHQCADGYEETMYHIPNIGVAYYMYLDMHVYVKPEHRDGVHGGRLMRAMMKRFPSTKAYTRENKMRVPDREYTIHPNQYYRNRLISI